MELSICVCIYGCTCVWIHTLCVCLVQKDVAYINWVPSELTMDDVASFYAVDESDHWTIIEDVPGRGALCM